MRFKAEVAKLWRERSIAARNDGLIFTIKSFAVSTGTSDSILKWKPQHSIDVRVHLANESWKVSANMNASSEMTLIESVTDKFSIRMSESKLLDAIRARQPCIVECVLSIEEMN